MSRPVRHIVIVGGGTAGWLAACRIAACVDPTVSEPVRVTVVESPDIPTIGVGEGTWPTMRQTLQSIGLDETTFILACDASFKQGSRFDGWVTGAPDDSYLHPFTPPPPGNPRELVQYWHEAAGGVPFATAMTPQARACDLDLAPRQRTMPAYTGALNYAYHFDAGKFARLLSRHATEQLGVRLVRDTVVAVMSAPDGGIAAVQTRATGNIEGDLFIDCTGLAALLIGRHCGAGWDDRSHYLFNDRALVIQAPVAPGSPIQSQTVATAHEAGWIWDIGLPQRRGVGCVYSSQFMDDEQAAHTLARYLQKAGLVQDDAQAQFRKLTFTSGCRSHFWDKNCIAIGLSAGFFEPLEASAIVMIELSLTALLDNFPASQETLPIHAQRFNALFRYRWERILDFLKLHYVLSRRDEPYWRAHRDPSTVPERLQSLLALWREQPPSAYDLPEVGEIFPAASYQYVLYGMGFPRPEAAPLRLVPDQATLAKLREVSQRARTLAAALPTNRAYLDALRRETGADQQEWELQT